jgi:hypothetical protein
MAEETSKNQEKIQPSADKVEAKPAAKETARETKAKKPPKLEDKPFSEFIPEHFVPSLKEALVKSGIEDLDLTFVQQGVPLKGTNYNEPCWQVVGKWQHGNRQFNLYFPDEDINSQKAFSYGTYGNNSSTIESFMIDEKRVTLELMVMYTLQRLNAQKWLTRN